MAHVPIAIPGGALVVIGFIDVTVGVDQGTTTDLSLSACDTPVQPCIERRTQSTRTVCSSTSLRIFSSCRSLRCFFALASTSSSSFADAAAMAGRLRPEISSARRCCRSAGVSVQRDPGVSGPAGRVLRENCRALSFVGSSAEEEEGQPNTDTDNDEERRTGCEISPRRRYEHPRLAHGLRLHVLLSGSFTPCLVCEELLHARR